MNIEQFVAANQELEVWNKLADEYPENVRIVCAAQRTEDGVIVLGVRHFDPIMHITFARLGISEKDKIKSESGFIDNYGRFLTREEAYDIHIGEGLGKLYSEELY